MIDVVHPEQDIVPSQRPCSPTRQDRWDFWGILGMSVQ